MSPTTPVHGDPWPRRFGRAVLTPFRPVSEIADAIEVRRRIQQSTATGRRIVLDDLGTGTDTAVVAALVARVLAHHRHDRVLAVDATDRLPPLGTRLNSHAAHALGEGVETGSFELAKESLSEAATGLWTVQAAQNNEDAYVSGLLPISRFFGVTLVAGGSGGPFVDAVAETAHAHVRVVRATRQSARKVGRRFDELLRDGRREEVERSVVVVFDQEQGEDPGFDAVRVTRIIAESGATALFLPHDRHLAQSLTLNTRRIAHATHQTALRIAAETMYRAAESVRPQYAGMEGGVERP